MARDGETKGSLNPRRILDWLFVTRLGVALGVFGSAIVVQDFWLPSALAAAEGLYIRQVSIVGLVLVGLLTAGSFAWIQLRKRDISLRFLYVQALGDVALVTGIAHVTGGSQSVIPPLLYVAMISVYALLVPIRGAFLITGVAAGSYVADMALVYPAQLNISVAFQVAVLLAVAGANGFIGGRLREVREELETMEGALRRLRLDTADILRAVGAGVMTLDEEGRVAYMNPAAEEMLDLRTEEWLTRDVRDTLSDRSRGLLSVVNETLRRERGVTERESQVHRPGRSEPIPVAVASAYLWRSGARASVTLVIQDLRPVRQMEDLRAQADRLHAVAELAASLAHEIRNPLASIRSAVDQLTPAEGQAEGHDRLVRLVRRESKRLDRLLGDFTDFAGISDVKAESMDVGALIEGVVDVAEQNPSAEGVDLQWWVEPDVGRVEGDPDLLHRALLNLVLNAMQVWHETDASEGDETLTVRITADAMSPELVPPSVVLDDAVQIMVRDDGPGIDAEDLDRIFDPFYSKRQGGSGLGLSIVYRTIRAHGGSITVSSEPGSETSFEIALPRKAKQREAPASPIL